MIVCNRCKRVVYNYVRNPNVITKCLHCNKKFSSLSYDGILELKLFCKECAESKNICQVCGESLI